jgi:hypothetical protein
VPDTLPGMTDVPRAELPGRRILWTSWAANVVFAATAVPAALGVRAFDDISIFVAVAFFLGSLGVWFYALGAAVVRSSRGDNVVVGNLFLFEGPVPKAVRWHLFGALGVCLVITAATAAAEPFGVLVPMLPLGLVGLWGARHGTFPPRSDLKGATTRRVNGRVAE